MSGKNDKTEQPTAKKLREARKEGRVARSPELAMWAQVLVAGFVLRSTVSTGSERLQRLLGQVEQAFDDADPNIAMQIFRQGMIDAFVVITPLLLAMALVAVLANVAQTKGTVSTKLAKPDFKRLNPLQGLKRLLSPHSLWEAAKAAIKVGVLSAVAWPAVHRLTAQLTGRVMPLGEALAVTSAAVLDLIQAVALAGLVLAAVDYVVMRRKVKKGLLMSKQEVKDEYRQSEGDPQIKSRIRQRQMEMSRNRMMAAVGDATVVVVNPTHVAVALLYDPASGAPRVVAKGKGLVAQRIREEAEKNKVPIVQDIPLARTLEKTVKVNQEIPPDLYEAVARILAFVFSLSQRRVA